MKRILLLLCVLLLVPVWAGAAVTVPEGVTEVGSNAFAGTDIDVLIIPPSVQQLGDNVLSGSNAVYIWLEGAETQVSSATASGVWYIFGPAASPASALGNFYAIEQLTNYEGLFCHMGETATLLCEEQLGSLSGDILVPKILNDLPVASLEQLYFVNPGAVTLTMPKYLTAPEGVSATIYETMSVSAPVCDVTTTPAGQYANWTVAEWEGAYGDVTFTWTFAYGGTEYTVDTTEPTVQFAPIQEGECVASVRVTDSLGDWAEATGEAITVTAAQTVYRALLVGNTYPDPETGVQDLFGPDNDLKAMETVLRSMPGTPFTTLRTSSNQTATGIQAAIASTFADAQPSDVSLFYYSGHGASTGALVGVNDTFLSVYGLRTALEKIPGTKVVILDCCFSGAAINKSTGTESIDLNAFNRAVIAGLSVQSRSTENLADGGFIVMTSCRKDQESSSLSGDLKYYWGVFTYGLCYGSGYDEWNKVSLGYLPADTNGDGAITLREAMTVVKERVAYLNTMVELKQAMQYHGDANFVLWKK